MLKQNPKSKLTIFLDNLRVHHTKGVKAFCAERDVELIFNVPYYPDGNPIETIFSKVKRIFKSYKAQDVVNGLKT